MEKKLILKLAIIAIAFSSCQRQITADFISDKNEYTAGEVIKLTNKSVNAKRYKWTLPDGQTTTMEHISYPIEITQSNAIFVFKLQAISKNEKKTDEALKYIKVKALSPPVAGSITELNCDLATNNGILISGNAASDVNSVLPYIGGNGGTYSEQTVSSTGVNGLTATLEAGTFANGAGSLTYNITGTPNGNGTASFAINIGGQTCTININVNLVTGTITALNCTTATNIGNLILDVAASGASSVVPYTNGNGGTHNGQTVSSTGVTGLTATLAPGTFATGAGNLTYSISGTPNAIGTASFDLNIGGTTCTLSRTVNLPAGTISALDCATANINGSLISGNATNGVNFVVPYTGGNGYMHNGQIVNSTSVTGVTATLAAGSFANGAGSLTYIVTGIPISSGTAKFLLNIGGKACNLNLTVISGGGNGTYPVGSIFCTQAAVVDVTNPTTGKIWMDRNLGAAQVATSSTDYNSYGDYYQWGRRSDGHQCYTSLTTSTLSTSDQPSHGDFIAVTNNNLDWRSPQNNSLWQGVIGINNPCPSGYRIPTEVELNAERLSWSSNDYIGAFNSPLKLPVNGFRGTDGTFYASGGAGYYWTSTVGSTQSRHLSFGPMTSSTGMTNTARVMGNAVRYIKD